MKALLINSRESLVTWGDDVRKRDIACPSAIRLAEIAASEPGAWIPADEVESAWRRTINHLILQTRLGVQPAAAVALLPTRLSEAPASLAGVSSVTGESAPIISIPKTQPEAPSVTEPQTVPESQAAPEPVPAVDPKVAMVNALIAWRSEQVAAGVPGADSLRDITLRNLVKFNRTTADEIREVLIGPAAELADDLAAVMARTTGAVAATPQAAPVPAPAPAPAPAPTPEPVPEPVVAPPLVEDSTPARHRRDIPGVDRTAAAPVSPQVDDVPAPATATRRMASPVAERASTTSSGSELTHQDFVAFSFPDEPPTPNALSIEQTPERVSVRWNRMEAEVGQTVLYRLVSGEDSTPYKPEAGELLRADTDIEYVDGRFLTTAFRVYQVWCHVGSDAVSARQNQPILWAAGEAVSAVEDFEIYEEDGRVIGRWSVRPGTKSVRVMRRSLDGGPTGSQQIAAGNDNLSGFVDQDVPRGRRFLYRAEAEVAVGDSVRLAPAAQQEVLVSVSLVPVQDLKATATDGASFDITWSTPQAGQSVDIYRFAAAPPAGLDSEDRDASAISVQGFTEADKIKDPIRLLDATSSQITGVRWPADWNRAYLTPVTSFNGRVRIGRTEILTRPIPPVQSPQIIERFHTQLITFGWPDGAAGVQVFVGMDTVPSEDIITGTPVADVNKSDYRHDGAIVLKRPLNAEGCKVCIVPVAYSHAEQLRGGVTDIIYPGLRRLHYELRPFQQAPPVPGVAAPAPSRLVTVALRSEVNGGSPLTLVAVNNPERLPLDQRDGLPLHFQMAGNQARPFAELGPLQAGPNAMPTPYGLDLNNVSGFVRLFVNDNGGPADSSQPRYALVDPPMRQLYIPPAPPQGQSFNG